MDSNLTEALADQRILRYLWVDNANVVRAKGVYLPTVRRGLAADVAAAPAAAATPEVVDPSTGDSTLRDRLNRAVTISQAQFALPVVADAVVAEAGLLPTHDVWLVPDWESLRALPYAPGHAAVACDAYDGEQPWDHCPRGFLRRMVARAEAAGLHMRVGVEFEFVLLDGTAAEAGRAVPADATVFAQDSALDRHQGLLDGITAALAAQGVEVAQVHAESAPGQLEVSLGHVAPLAAADAIVMARQTIHAVARAHGLVATFLPIVDPAAGGSGMHVHLSITGEPEDGLGVNGASFMAGILEHLTGLLAVTAPTPMSFARFRPHFWVGAFLGWGVGNKEVPLRVVPGRSGAPRDVEFKAIDATANPYLALGCLLAAGVAGVEHGTVLPTAVEGDPGLLSAGERAARGIAPMPTDAQEVLDALAADSVLSGAMGQVMMAAYVAVKRAESAELEAMDPSDRVALLLERY
ncbi:MAG: Glutamine synthetase [Actinomycetota bacterium]|nr:Glutamine synthetase [Actinomycetota bacterium]